MIVPRVLFQVLSPYTDSSIVSQYLYIGKYLSSLRTFDHVILLKEGFEAQLRASRPSIPFGMSTLGMTRQIRDGCLQGSIQPSHVPALQGLDNVAQDVHGTHGHLACRHGHLHEELSHVGQKPFQGGGGNGDPNQPLNDGRIFGVKGMQIGVGFPFLGTVIPLAISMYRPGRSCRAGSAGTTGSSANSRSSWSGDSS